MALRISTGLRNKVLGINTTKITNGSFSSDTTGWTASNATLTSVGSGYSGNCLQIAETGGASPGKAYQDITTKIGHPYRVILQFKKGTADNGKFMIGTTSDEDSIYDSGNLSDASWTEKSIWFIATATTTRLTLQTNDATASETSLFDEVQLISMSRAIQDVFKDGFIKIYTGSQPSSADAAPTGTLLCTYYSDGAAAGLEFDDAVSGVIAKKSSETWSGQGVATGTAGWFRLQAPGDSEAYSTTDERIDGAIATSGAELNFSSTSIVTSAMQTISSFQLTWPSGS
jgi:hypothetical protein